MEKDILEDRLLAFAHWRAARRGFRFGKGAEQDLRQMVEDTVDRILTGDRRGMTKTQMITAAEKALGRMVSEMIKARGLIIGYADAHPDTIGEQTMGWARSKLCPLFPIC